MKRITVISLFALIVFGIASTTLCHEDPAVQQPVAMEVEEVVGNEQERRVVRSPRFDGSDVQSVSRQYGNPLGGQPVTPISLDNIPN